MTFRNIYRFCILPVSLAVIRLISRIRMVFYRRSLTYLFCNKFKLVSKQIGFASPGKNFRRKTRRLADKLTSEAESLQAIFSYLKSRKRRATSLPWVSPEEAWLLPALDCKAFSVLLLELLKGLGIKSELWIGLNSRQEIGHAWLELALEGEKRALDRDYCQAVPLEEYRLNHTYALVTRVA